MPKSPLAPASRPQIDRAAAQKIIAEHDVTAPVVVIGIPGYYAKSMGPTSGNDRGEYDDAILVYSPNAFVTFNGNVDPSVWRDGIATLQPGVYDYRLGIHGLSRPKAQQYEALVQAGPIIVARDGTQKVKAGTHDHRGYCLGNGLWTDGHNYPDDKFAVNIHRGGVNTTSSLGCQTVPPDQYEGFLSLVKGEIARAGAKGIKYILTDR